MPAFISQAPSQFEAASFDERLTIHGVVVLVRELLNLIRQRRLLLAERVPSRSQSMNSPLLPADDNYESDDEAACSNYFHFQCSLRPCAFTGLPQRPGPNMATGPAGSLDCNHGARAGLAVADGFTLS